MPEKRPVPAETIGLYFEQIEQFGEDAMINWDVNGENDLYHHAGDDGTSSFNDIIKNKNLLINEIPQYTPRPSLNFWQKIKSIIRLYSRIPHTCAVLKKSKVKNSPRQNASIYFSKEETKKYFKMRSPLE